MKTAEKFSDIKSLSNEAIAVYSTITLFLDKKNVGFIELSDKKIGKLTGLDENIVKTSLEELKAAKLVFQAGIPLDKSRSYQEINSKTGEIENKEIGYKKVHITNTDYLSVVLSKVEKILSEKEINKKSNINSWENKVNNDKDKGLER